ncbi:MAG: AAA family ATPase, partial [Ignavibacteria bacterium]|nr:AAA family ATPase [Ignavibacteria bacterium]
ALGVLEKGHLIECDRSGLVKGYIGQTAIQTSYMIEKSLGGILFIDEAYSLTNKGDRDFGSEAIEVILKKMDDLRGRFVVICAGYTEEMNFFLESNPGLKSRFDRSFEFSDYTEKELHKILIMNLKKYDLEIDNEIKEKLKEIISRLFNSKVKYFGNAREIRKITEQIILNHDLRLADLTSYERSKIDINKLEESDFKIKLPEIMEKKIEIGFRLYE